MTKVASLNQDNPTKPGVILVVDDEWINREMMQALLEGEGYRVMLAHGGQQALEMVAAQPPDLVLTDVRMPGMNGYDLCARLKSDAATRHIPVVLISGLESEADQQRGIEAGADDFVGKPLDTLIMLNRLKTLLRIKRLHDVVAATNNQVRYVLSQHLDPATVETIMRDLASAQAARS